MRFSEIINEAPRNDPEELKRRTDRAKGALDKQSAEKAKISSRASELGKKGAQQRALNKDFKEFNKGLRKDELEKRDREKQASDNKHEEPSPQEPHVDSRGRTEPTIGDDGQAQADASNPENTTNDFKAEVDDTILSFLKQQIKAHKRKRGVEGDQGVEERDVIEFAKHKYPKVDPTQIDKIWAEVKGHGSSVANMNTSAMAADAGGDYNKGGAPDDNKVKDLDAKVKKQTDRQERSTSRNQGGGRNQQSQTQEFSMGNVMSKLRDMDEKDIKKFKEFLQNG